MEPWDLSRWENPQRCFREKAGCCDHDDDVENREVLLRSLHQGCHAARRWDWHAASLRRPARDLSNIAAPMEALRPCRCCSLGCWRFGP